jgi:4-hydroxy-4-methyl-2-oxoglutarate aldolase
LKTLSTKELNALRSISTPTVSNAIELFNVRPKNEGFMSGEIKCIFPDMGVMVGYACTAVMLASWPDKEREESLDFRMYEHILQIPAPRVVVVQDIDEPPCIGSLWGEVNGNIHKALGCVGVVTNGGVRDLDEVHELGFHFFAAQVIPSHAYDHLVDVGSPVKVGGLVVNPGDLIHADKHGVVVIPGEVASELAEAARRVEESERGLINLCKSPDFTLEKLKDELKKL